MGHDTRRENEQGIEDPGICESLLREAFLENSDPDLTLFLQTLLNQPRSRTEVSVGSWKGVVTPAATPDELGRLDGHVLREVIAEGRMATVFRADEPSLDRTVALKMLAPELAGSATSRERFLHEAKTAAGLDHESILPIYRVGDEGVPYFTMRYVKGGTLQDRLDRGELPGLSEWYQIARQIGGALRAAHGIGLIHRDIKPANLLFDDEGGRLWVADFGISETPEGNPFRSDTVIGTPRYMSPEQACGRTVDGRSDLFSLGAVLFRCATGTDLVSGENSAEVLHQLATTDFAAIAANHPGIDSTRRRILSGLLASDPSGRFETASKFLEAIEAADPAAPKDRRRLRPGFTVAWLAACALALTAFWIGSIRPARDVTPTISGVPSLPEIRIEGDNRIFRDFESAFAASSDGATLLISGVVVCRKTQYSPIGLRIHIRPAPGSHPVVMAATDSEHSLFLRGPAEVQGIRFVRDSSGGNVVPVIGFYGGDAVVKDCEFSAPPIQGPLLGSTISFTHLENALIERCRFEMRGREAVGVSFVDGSPAMKVTLKECAFLASNIISRRIWGGHGGVSIETDRCVFVGDRWFFDHPRNAPAPVRPLRISAHDGIFDMRHTMIHFANGGAFTSPDSLPFTWEGKRNRHSHDSLRVTRSDPSLPFVASAETEVAWSNSSGGISDVAESESRISPMRPSGGEIKSLREVIDILRKNRSIPDSWFR